MFPANTPMLLTDVRFTTEDVDEEIRRIVVCTFALQPLTSRHADALAIRSLLFDLTSGQPKDAIETATVRVSVPMQRLSFAMAPDQTDRRVVLANVEIDDTVRVAIKRDRDPVTIDAKIKVRFAYPSADDLLYLASGVDDTHYLTFEPEQRDLLTSATDGDDVPEPPRRGRVLRAGAVPSVQ